MPDLITSTNPNAFTPSMLCTTSIGLIGGIYAGLYFSEEAGENIFLGCYLCVNQTCHCDFHLARLC